MDVREKLEREIARKKKIVEDGQSIMEQVPKYLRPNQEFVLEIYKKQIEALEAELAKLQKENTTNKFI